MSKRRFLLFLSLALLSAVLLTACGEAKPPQDSTSAVQTTQTEDAGAHVQNPAADLTPWGTTLRLSVPDGAVGVSVTRTVVNHLGQELSAEYDVPCSAAGEVTHTPFGGIFAAPCPDGTVYVDGKQLDEPYVTEKSFGDCNIELPYQVPESRYFCMGDHRSTSADSRHSEVGCVAEEQVVGKIVWRVWPLAGFGRLQ